MVTRTNKIPKRKNSLRLKNFDYSTPQAYFITICAENVQDFFLNKKLAENIIDVLRKNKKRFKYKIYAYCLMPDHLHILLNPGGSNKTVSGIIQAFKSQTSHNFKGEYGLPLWQRGFYDHIVRDNEDLLKIAQYILENPRRKKLVDQVEDYPFSGLWDEIEV
ncbi:MAG: transposase [Candidatus Zixiibacteriota bacterium]